MLFSDVDRQQATIHGLHSEIAVRDTLIRQQRDQAATLIRNQEELLSELSRLHSECDVLRKDTLAEREKAQYFREELIELKRSKLPH